METGRLVKVRFGWSKEARAPVTSLQEAKVVPVAATGNVRARLQGLVALSTRTVRPACHMLWGVDPAHWCALLHRYVLCFGILELARSIVPAPSRRNCVGDRCLRPIMLDRAHGARSAYRPWQARLGGSCAPVFPCSCIVRASIRKSVGRSPQCEGADSCCNIKEQPQLIESWSDDVSRGSLAPSVVIHILHPSTRGGCRGRLETVATRLMRERSACRWSQLPARALTFSRAVVFYASSPYA